MSVEMTTEEKRELVEALASEHGIPTDKAEACLVAVEWDIDAASRVADLNRIEHLLIKLRFYGRNPLPHSGLVAIILKRGENEPERVIGLTRDGSEFIDEISPHFPAVDFVKAVLNPPRQYRENPTWPSLQQVITFNLNSENIETLFQAGKAEEFKIDSETQVSGDNPFKDLVSELLTPNINELFMESARIDVNAKFLNGFQYHNLDQLFDDEEEVTTESKKTNDVETFRVNLTGRLVIDPHHGILVEELEEGDTLICDVIDSSPVALEVGKMLGFYKKGVWFPTKGRIVSIEEGASGSKRILICAGRGVYILTTALSSVRVKVSENELESIRRRIELHRDESVRSTLNYLPIALIILGVALALTILLQRG